MPDYDVIVALDGQLRAGVRYRDSDNRVTAMYCINNSTRGFVLDVEFAAFTGRPPIHVEQTAADPDLSRGVPTNWNFDCVPLGDGGRDVVDRDTGEPVLASYGLSLR